MLEIRKFDGVYGGTDAYAYETQRARMAIRVMIADNEGRAIWMVNDRRGALAVHVWFITTNAVRIHCSQSSNTTNFNRTYQNRARLPNAVLSANRQT